MKNTLAVLICLFALRAFATDFHVSLLNDYKTLVYGKVYWSSRSVLELEILDTIALDGAEDLKKGLKITIPYYNHQHTINEEREAVLALRKESNNWRVERIFLSDKKDDYKLNLRNRFSSISISVQEFAEGLKLVNADLILKFPSDRTIYYGYNLGTVTLKVSEDKFKRDLSNNAFFAYLFEEWDYFECFTAPLNFGFWHDLAIKKDSLIAANNPLISTPFIDQSNKTNRLFTRFQSLDSTGKVVSDNAYFFDPLIDSFRLVYTFVPDAPFKQEETPVIFLNNYGFYPFRTLSTHQFGDYYFPDNAMFQLGILDFPQIVLPQYETSGVVHFYTKSSDSLIARLTNGQFTGQLHYFTDEFYYEKNFNEQGQAHGAFAIYTQPMGSLMHYEHYTNNAKSGHYYATYPTGHAHLIGSYFNNRRIGEWVEYYPYELDFGIKSKNNYAYYDNSIYNEVSSSWTNPKLLSNRCIDDENIRSLHGFQIYYDTDGEKLSFQNWKNGELLERQDWYKKNISSGVLSDSLGGIRMVFQDTTYHTIGQYKNNQPWSGTFLVGAHNYRGGLASGQGPHIVISVDTYAEGAVVKSEIIYESHSGQLNWTDNFKIDPKTGETLSPKRKRLFKKKKKYVMTCGGKLIEISEEKHKKTRIKKKKK
jgi:antitoxin component YwqK of YwqJK toxin-antitoxin module